MLLQSAVFVEFDENFSKSQGGMVAVEIYSHIKRLVKVKINMIKSYNYLNTRGEDQYNNLTTPEPQPPNNLTSPSASKSRKIERMWEMVKGNMLTAYATR